MNGPLFMTTLSIFVHSLEEWKANKLIFLKRLVLLAHLRSTSPAPVETYVVKSFHPAFVNFSELACIKNKLFVVLKASGFSYFFHPLNHFILCCLWFHHSENAKARIFVFTSCFLIFRIQVVKQRSKRIRSLQTCIDVFPIC